MNTQHYDLTGRGQTQLILDTWKNQATIIDNDVIPASRENPVIQGTENQANSIRKSGGQLFTTFPLYPLSKDVNFLFQDYINLTLNLRFVITSELAKSSNPFENKTIAIYFPSTACIPSRLQLLCGNSSIWSNTFHRQEARLTAASLPNAVIDKSPDYFAINKLFRHHEFPGFIINDLEIDEITEATKLTYPWLPMGFIGSHGVVIEKTLNLNIDLNQLTPLLSNIPFITSEMGELRLRMFFENLERAMCFSIFNYKTNEDTSNIIEVYPVNHDIKVNEKLVGINLCDWDMSQGAEIVQSCFSIKEESKMEIKKYIAQDNKITIPTQTWSSNVATNDFKMPNSELVFQVSAYNVNVLSFLFPMYCNDVCYPNPLFKELDVKFNSKSVNYIPYKPFDMRIYKDTIQALLNDDCIGANTNLTESINPGYLINGDNDDFTETKKDILGDEPKNNKYYWRNPNNFCLAFGLSPVNTFEKGFNMASSNPGSTQIRLKYSYFDRGNLFNNYKNDEFYNSIPNLITKYSPSNPICACLCDCCLVLEYNPIVGRAQSGCLVFAEPTLG